MGIRFNKLRTIQFCVSNIKKQQNKIKFCFREVKSVSTGELVGFDEDEKSSFFISGRFKG